MTNRFEENKPFPWWIGWAFVILLSCSVIAWGLLNYVLVQDAPRQWEFGQLPQTPGESEYSSNQAPQPASAPAQLIPLPEIRGRLREVESAEHSRPRPATSPAAPAGQAGGSHD